MQRLIESLRLLAATAEEQRDALPKHVNVPDELALIFGDELLGARDAVAAQPTRVQEALNSLNDKLDKMSDDQHHWEAASLDADPEWALIRTHAREVLEAMGIASGRPKLDWLTYV